MVGFTSWKRTEEANSMGDLLRIGVSGHRFLSELDHLRQSVDAALNRLAAAFPGRPFSVLSSLAEGADRLVAGRTLLWPGARLVAVLPLTRDLYLADFVTRESHLEFESFLARASETIELPARENRDECYEAAGEYIVHHCDALFAIWDGQRPQGRGGTGAIVERARVLALPLVWVHAGNRVPGGTEPTSLGAEQGMLTFERIHDAVGPR
jgi:hypothetical protein